MGDPSKRPSRSTLYGSAHWPRSLTVIACIWLLFFAPIAEGQVAAGRAASGQQVRTRAWKVHAFRGNRPVYRRAGEILVQFKKGANRDLSKTPGVAAMIRGTRASRGDVQALTFDEDAVEFAALRDRLLATAGVLRVEPNIIFSTQRSQSPLAGVDYSTKQWHLNRTQGQSALMRRSRASRSARAATRVGVVDTGVDYGHLEFTGRTLPGVNLISHPFPDESTDSESDFNGHGTRVAGIIAAADDGVGVLGINPRAEICSIKTFNRDGDGYLEDIIAGIDWAIAHQMQVLNMSFGTYEYSELFQEAISRAQSAGILLVAAAGNDAADAAMFPAAFTGVLSVGAYDKGGWTSSFSNWGADVDFHTPGDQLLTTDLWHDGDDPYTVFTGTSAAAAYATGVASLLIEDGESADSAANVLRQNVIAHPSDYHVRPQPDLWLNDRLILSRLLGEQYSDVAIVSFKTDRSIFAHGDDVSITYAIQNTGTRPSAPTQASLAVSEGETVRRVDLGSVPHLAPGERYEASMAIAASQLLAQASNPDSSAHRIRVELALGSFPLATYAPRRLLITEEPLNGTRVRALWVSPLDFNDACAERTLYATLENAGRNREDGLVARVYAVAAVHEGVGQVPKIDLGTIQVGSLMPGEMTQLSLPLTSFEPPAQRVTFWMEVEENGRPLTRYLQGYQYSAVGGIATPEYAQVVHRAIADEAIKLLAAQGINIPDLAPGSVYRGIPTAYNSWPETTGLPTATWSDTGYWTDAHLASGAATLGLNGFTLIDGSHDADGVDIAFGYSFQNNFDSHFWIVDNNDDDGLDGSGTNHHSALSKLRALLYGPNPQKGVPADNQLAYGAIDHYRAGYKQAAWWFVGHAVHLIGDLSVPSHVDNENLHGAYGATYHDWMDRGNYTRWDFNDALSRGGLIDPYDSVNLGDPLRYLGYTTAQLGNSFPWASTLITTTFAGDGNRTAGGNTPHYDAKMQALFATLPSRPLVDWHVNKDEVWDSFTPFDNCQLVDFVGLTESRRDCWGGPDGHIDIDNTDSDASGKANDSDGDLGRIGIQNYPYAIRAAAGLIYYFAVETGQLTRIVSNTNDGGPGSLRKAIADSLPGYVITVDASLSGQTVSLTTGQLTISKNLTIDASALPGGLIVTGNNLSRVFEIGSGQTVSIKGLTIRGGRSDFGGGIRNNGTLNLTDSTVSGNQATNQGGGIYNFFGNLTLRRVTLSGNTSSSQGGAIWAAGATTWIENSTVQGNQANNYAGIVNENGSLTVVHSTIAGNNAVGANSIGGGVIHLYGQATTKIENSIVALNTAVFGPDVYKNTGSVTPTGRNLIGKNDSVSVEFPAGPLVGTAASPLNPLLAPLANNGGPTLTMFPLASSPAIDAALATGLSPTTDQRSVSRPKGPAADLGAVEFTRTHVYQLVGVTTAGGKPVTGAFTYNETTGTVEWVRISVAADPAYGLLADTFSALNYLLVYGPSHQVVAQSTTSNPSNNIVLNLGALLGTRTSYVLTQAPSPGGASYIYVGCCSGYDVVNGSVVEYLPEPTSGAAFPVAVLTLIGLARGAARRRRARSNEAGGSQSARA